MIIVIVVVSLMGILVIPRMSVFLGNKRENFALFTGMISKTYDDSFLHDRTNFLVIHLDEPSSDDTDIEDDVFKRQNGVSVLNYAENKFRETEKKILKFREFPSSFRIEQVLLSTGEIIGNGSVMVPFYPRGYSDNVIVHVLVNDEEKWSVRILKYKKEPEVKPDYISFEKHEN